MHEGLCQERMQVIVVDDFAAFYNTERRADLRRSPFPGLGDTDGNGVCTVVPGKGISLRRSDADLTVLRKRCRCFIRRASCTHGIRPSCGKEGQKEGEYEHKHFHEIQR